MVVGHSEMMILVLVTTIVAVAVAVAVYWTETIDDWILLLLMLMLMMLMFVLVVVSLYYVPATTMCFDFRRTYYCTSRKKNTSPRPVETTTKAEKMALIMRQQ